MLLDCDFVNDSYRQINSPHIFPSLRNPGIDVNDLSDRYGENFLSPWPTVHRWVRQLMLVSIILYVIYADILSSQLREEAAVSANQSLISFRDK